MPCKVTDEQVGSKAFIIIEVQHSTANSYIER